MQLLDRLNALPTPAQLDAAGRYQALFAFQRAARTVPAYANLLRHLGVDVRCVWSYREFRRRVPLTDARHFLDAYPLSERCAVDALDGGVVAVDSPGAGLTTTGRSERAGLRRALRHILTFFVDARSRATLAVVLRDAALGLCIDRFADGLRSLASDRRLRLSVAGPVQDAASATDLFAHFLAPGRQTLLIGSPAALERAAAFVREHAAPGPAPHVSVLCVGAGVTPAWRTRVGAQLRVARLNRFGGPQLVSCLVDAEQRPLAWESPYTVLISEIAARDERVCRELFGGATPRPIAQYNPLCTWIESVRGRLCVTRSGAEPRIRYLTDLPGAALSASDVDASLRRHGYDAVRILRALGWPPGVRYPMPICRFDAVPVEASVARESAARANAVKPIRATYIR